MSSEAICPAFDTRLELTPFERLAVMYFGDRAADFEIRGIHISSGSVEGFLELCGVRFETEATEAIQSLFERNLFVNVQTIYPHIYSERLQHNGQAVEIAVVPAAVGAQP